MKSGKFRVGFTLIEVLIVIAIVTVLATLTFVAIRSIGASSHQATCTSHLSSIYRAFVLYSADHSAGTDLVGDLKQIGFPYWPFYEGPGKVWKYIPDAPADWQCPAATREPIAQANIQYEYVLSEAQHTFGSDVLTTLTGKYGSALPVVADFNHNNPSVVDIYAPRVKKRVGWVDLGGSVKWTWRTESFSIPGYYPPYGFTYP